MAVDLELSDFQNMAREFAHSFAAEKIRPRAQEADRLERVPDDLLLEMKQIADMMGGMGGGGGEAEENPFEKGSKRERQFNRLAVIGGEEFSWGDAGIMLTNPGPGLGGPPVMSTGTPEQKERFLSIFKSPEPKWGAYATTEPGCGSDVSGIQTRVTKDGDYYVINGTKIFITCGNLASWVVVFGTLDPSLGRAGHRALVVEKGTPGFIQGQKFHKMGLRASDTAILTFDECRVHKDNLLGGEEYYASKGSGGFKVAMGTFDATRPMVAIMSIGIARGCYEYTRDWIKEQYSLGRPIPRYTQIKEKLAEMERKLDSARLLAWRAAWMADVGQPNTKEASMAKAYAGTVSVQVCSDCVDLMGDSGSVQDHPVEKWFRDIKVFDIFEGTGQVNRLVVARRMYEPFGIRV